MATFNSEHFNSFKGYPCLVKSENEIYLYYGYVEALSENAVILRQAQCLGSVFDQEDVAFYASDGIPSGLGEIGNPIEQIYLTGLEAIAKCSQACQDSIANHKGADNQQTFDKYAESPDEEDFDDYGDEEDYKVDQSSEEFAPPEELLTPVANALNRLEELDNEETELYDEDTYEEEDEDEDEDEVKRLRVREAFAAKRRRRR